MSRELLSDVSENCNHNTLIFEPSSHAVVVGYHRPTLQQRTAATRTNNVAANPKKDTRGTRHQNKDGPATFPAPLVLPGDDLASDPRCPPQSLRAWLRLKDRKQVTRERGVLYVAAPPDVEDDVDFMSAWSSSQRQADGVLLSPPNLQDVVGYLSAFYDGLPLKKLPTKLSFTSWDIEDCTGEAISTSPAYIGLNTGAERVRIRTRAPADGVFTRQFNLDDLLDAAISILPDDAYALLMLVQHDIYESEEDYFVCGRAYGGSRVAVVSMARYHPLLDWECGVARGHGWPASHCAELLCTATPQTNGQAMAQRGDLQQRTPRTTPMDEATMLPMHAAVHAHNTLSRHEASSAKDLSALWLARVCRTSSHELGHCFGIDHCIYYACIMQSCASLAEDARQPPYLCPVDLVKVLRATGGDEEHRYLALLSFCAQREHAYVFSAFAAWIRARLGATKSGK